MNGGKSRRGKCGLERRIGKMDGEDDLVERRYVMCMCILAGRGGRVEQCAIGLAVFSRTEPPGGKGGLDLRRIYGGSMSMLRPFFRSGTGSATCRIPRRSLPHFSLEFFVRITRVPVRLNVIMTWWSGGCFVFSRLES